MRVVEYVKDVTGEMALRSELLQHERKSMIVKMSAQVAHEIRNPLGSLTLNVDLLDDAISGYQGPEAVEAKELIVTIKNEIESLHKVLREYLECTRFPKIQPAKQDVNIVIEDLFVFLRRSSGGARFFLKQPSNIICLPACWIRIISAGLFSILFVMPLRQCPAEAQSR